MNPTQTIPTPPPKNPERRHRIYFMPYSYLPWLFENSLATATAVRLPRPGTLPPDVKVVAVSPDYQRNALAVILESKTFDEVTPNMMAPALEVEWEVVEVLRYRGGIAQ